MSINNKTNSIFSGLCPGSGSCDLSVTSVKQLILTHAVIVVRELEAGEAEAVVGAHGVLTGAVATGLSVTFVNVWNTNTHDVTEMQQSPVEAPVSHCVSHPCTWSGRPWP